MRTTAQSAVTTLSLTRELLDELTRLALSEAPRECCGILTGIRRPPALCVTSVIPAPNIAQPDRTCAYQVDWRTLLATITECRHGTDRVIGFYHSHPTGSAAPSRTDLGSAWRDHAYLILGPQDPTPSAAAWYLHPKDALFRPLELAIDRVADRADRRAIAKQTASAPRLKRRRPCGSL